MNTTNIRDPDLLLSEAGRSANRITIKEAACINVAGGTATTNSRSEVRQNAAHVARAQKEKALVEKFWQTQFQLAHKSKGEFKDHLLPLARIKKVMKTDEEVRMISAEAPLVFSKACEVFITELSIRAWLNAEDNKRRTLQRSDIAVALTKSDQFDFLIDIVPRDEFPHTNVNAGSPHCYLSPAHLAPLPANLSHQQPGPQLDYSPLANQHYFYYAGRDTNVLLGTANRNTVGVIGSNDRRAHADSSDHRGSKPDGQGGGVPTSLGSEVQHRSLAHADAYYQQAAAAIAAAANLSPAFTSAPGLAASSTYLQQLQHYQQLQAHFQQQHSAANALAFQPQPNNLSDTRALAPNHQRPRTRAASIKHGSSQDPGCGQPPLSVSGSASPLLLTSSSSPSLAAKHQPQLR